MFNKIKKEEFIKTFKNVLITLDYDVKLESSFREEQCALGLKMLYEDLNHVIPLVNKFYILSIIYEKNKLFILNRIIKYK